MNKDPTYEDALHAEARVEAAEHASSAIRLISETTRTLLPLMVSAGLATHADVEMDTLEARLRDEALRLSSTLVNAGIIGARTHA